MKRIEMLKIMDEKVECKKGCGDCCGIVPFATEEFEAIPQELKKGVTFDKVGPHYMPRPFVKLNCPFLKSDDSGNKRCGIYEYRPLMCKAFGRLENLTCPHGANTKKLIKAKHFRKFLEKSNYPQKSQELKNFMASEVMPVFLSVIKRDEGAI